VLHLGSVGDIHLDKVGLAAGALDRGDRLLAGLGVIVGHHHTSALTGEKLGGRAANARGPAGDDGHLAHEPH